MSIISPRALVVAVAGLILLAGAYAGYWFYAAALLEDGFADWRSARQAQGYTVTHGAVSVIGFPTALRLTVADPSIADPRRGWSWRGRRVSHEIAPWNWYWYRLEFEGSHEAALTVDGRRRVYQGEAKSAVFIGRALSSGGIDKGALDVTALRIRESGGDAVSTIKHLRLRLEAAGTPDGRPDMRVALMVARAHLAEGAAFALGSDIARLEAHGTLRGGVPARVDHAAFDRWRAGGGIVDLEWLKLAWGPLDLEAKGTVTLDERMRPLGVLTADIRGHNETIDVLEQARLLRRKAAATSRIALSLLAKPDKDGKGSVLTVPVTAQDGRLYLGFVRLFVLPPIPFPARSG